MSSSVFGSQTAPEMLETHVPLIWKTGDLILGQYEVIDLLGEGGMGTVQKVHHRGWNIDLAVKSPQPGTFISAGGADDFVREAETWVKLDVHPHIVTCYYVRTLGGIPRIFIECVSGGSLADWVKSRRLYQAGQQAALERILDIAIQFAWGLHAAHEQGLVHQDVKPANVMMSLEGVAKVTDFGLARARAIAGDANGPAGASEQSILVSSRGMTPAYCSPEQAERRALSRKTDIWSWGLSVLQMFVGGVTWTHGTLARAALAGHRPVHPAIPAMPPAMVQLLARCFQIEPQDRPATMLAIAERLQEIYVQTVGRSYERTYPQRTSLQADSLNNRALSLYDLGKTAEAEAVWTEALSADPQHLESNYNAGLHVWRTGRITDDVLVKQIKVSQDALGDPWQGNYLLARVHMERGDSEAVLPLLSKAVQQKPDEREVQTVFARVKAGQVPAIRFLYHLQGHTKTVLSLCVSADGRFALSGSSDKTARLWDLRSRQCLRVLVGHTDQVNSVCMSRDGLIERAEAYVILLVFGRDSEMNREQMELPLVQIASQVF